MQLKRGQIVYVKQHSSHVQWVRTKVEGFGDGLIFVTLNNKRVPIYYPNVISAQDFRKLKVV